MESGSPQKLETPKVIPFTIKQESTTAPTAPSVASVKMAGSTVGVVLNSVVCDGYEYGIYNQMILSSQSLLSRTVLQFTVWGVKQYITFRLAHMSMIIVEIKSIQNGETKNISYHSHRLRKMILS